MFKNLSQKLFVKNQRFRIVLLALVSLILNIVYALFNTVFGLLNHSYWFITVGAYHTILAVIRFSAVIYERKSTKEENRLTENFIKKFSGNMLLILSCVLCGATYLSVKFDVANNIHEIVMITIATYTTTKITFAVINFIKVKGMNSPVLSTLRNISLCDAAVSVFSMQRSMLVSFGEMTDSNIKLMNTLTGIGVSFIVALLGILMIFNKEKKNG